MITSLPPEDDGLARFFGKLLQAQHRKERVLDVLVEGAIELLNAESGYLVRELKGNLFFYRRWGERPDGNKKAVSRAIVRYALGRGEPVLVPDVGESEFAMRESVEAQSLRSVLASRIDAEEEVALYIESGSRAMGPEDLGLFRTIVEMTNPILVEDARRLMNGNGADVERNYDLGDFVAEDPKTLSLLDLAAKVAATEHPVLVTGPNGSGKERVADFVHRNSSRAKQALHPMNCTTLTESLAESLLFGQEAGAFTGAKEAKGAFGEADGSTLLLDEIGELKPDLQVKLLRVLESQEVQPLGARRPKKVNVRVLAATNRDLELAVRQGVFREDLFHRLNVFRIEVPPLAERPGDVMPLFRHFLSDLCVDDPLPRFTREARDALEAHRWSGNVREVRNLAIRLATFHAGETVDVKDLPGVEPVKQQAPSGAPAPEAPPPSQAVADDVVDDDVVEDLDDPETSGEPEDLADLADNERQTIIEHLKRAGGNKSQAARTLDISREGLRLKLKRYDIRPEEWQDDEDD